MNRYLTLGLLLICIYSVLAQYPRRKPTRKPQLPVPKIDKSCLECICQGSSNCDETLKCHNTGDGGYFCGPYVISWAYWHDAGRPGDKGHPHDFEACLNDKSCAETVVTQYMAKNGQDCDGNGVIDCFDFARIHKLGPNSCSGEYIEKTDYYEKFDVCYSSYGASYNNNNDGNYNDGNYNVDRNDNSGVPGDYVDYGEGQINARNGQQG